MPQTIISDVGTAKVTTASQTNTAVAITHIALGDGSGANYAPDYAATGLRNELARVAILNRVQINANTWRVRAEFPSTIPVFAVREIGFFDGDNDLICLWSGNDVVPRQTGGLEYLVDLTLNFSNQGEGTIIIEAPDDAVLELGETLGDAIAELTLEQARQGDVLATFITRYHIDQATGNDTAAGTADAPLRSIERLLEIAPRIGVTEIYVRGDYVTTAQMNAEGRRLRIVGCDGSLATFDPAGSTAARPDFEFGVGDVDGVAEVFGFSAGYGAYVDLLFFVVALPSEADVTADLPGSLQTNDIAKAAFALRQESHMSAGGVGIRNSTLTFPADYYGTLLSGHIGWNLWTDTTVISGSYAGKLHPDVSAGALADDVTRYVRTNLATL